MFIPSGPRQIPQDRTWGGPHLLHQVLWKERDPHQAAQQRLQVYLLAGHGPILNIGHGFSGAPLSSCGTSHIPSVRLADNNGVFLIFFRQ